MPLTYEVSYHIDGKETSTVKVSRSSNGSIRKDAEDPDHARIEILNRNTSKFYRLQQAGDWNEHPMRPQPNQGRPYLQLRKDAVTEVPSSDPRVESVAQQVGIPVRFYELALPGTRWIFCPELNMLDVWREQQYNGTVTETKVTTISLGEPPVAFAPPPTAQIVRRKEPDGPGSATRTPSGMELRDGRLMRQ